MQITEVMRRFPDQATAIVHLEKIRWGGRPICPYCASDKVCVHASKDKKLPRWQCEVCHRAFSATVGTIFHHTHLPLQTWFLALAIMLNAKKNVSNLQLSRDLGLPYKTAWSLALRIREAMLTDPAQRQLFRGIVEMDETYIGGKPRKANRRADDKKHKRGRGTDKTPVVGIVERLGRVIAQAVDKTMPTAGALKAILTRFVDTAASIVITRHYAVNRAVAYVSGDAYTNTTEGFWALVKQSLCGKHHFYSDKWANHFIVEVSFQYNNRSNPNSFGNLLRHMASVAA